MKNLFKELILPSFWLFFFIVSSKSEDKVNKFKKTDNTELKKQDGISASGATNGINKNKEATFIKAVYLSGF
jgi:uncharacterized membrane protein